MAKSPRRDTARRSVTYDKTRFTRRALTLALLALALTLYVELMNRALSLPRLFGFVTGSPGLFLCNCMIVLTSLVFSELFRRRRAMLGTLCLLWLVLGMVQFMVQRDRTTPFSSMDLLLIREAFSLITIYCTWPQIIAMFLGVFLAIALIIAMFARLRRRRRVHLARAVLAFVGCVLTCAAIAAVGVRTERIPRRFTSLVENYSDYGFPLVFTYTFGQKGISRPDDYTDDSVADILRNIDEASDSDEFIYPTFGEDDNTAHPNIIFLQLESFFDVSTIRGCEVSRDPSPWFNRLCARFPSGLLYVPTIGGGTVNTEFEILTGLNLDSFGAGEQPYNTILQEATCETIAYNLKDYGYTATAMHNNGATFYSRNAVYPRLGFDRFVPLEYMPGVHYTSLGWARDDVLTGEIIQALESTPGRDLVMCITVESHGKYADTYEAREGDIEVLSLPEGIPMAPFQNYVNIIPNTDEFLRRTISALLSFDEPTVVVAYGDHLPALELQNDMLTTDSIYASRYVIWNNFSHSFDAPDMMAYRLSAHLLGQLGFSGGAVTRLHQSVDPTDTSEEYLARLEVLGYDMLYGDQQVFDGDEPYPETDMRLGVRDIVITDAQLDYHRLLLTGENFTEFSRIVADGQTLDTLYVDSGHIIARAEQSDAPIGSQSEAAGFAEIAVAQVDRDGVELGRTPAFDMSAQDG